MQTHLCPFFRSLAAFAKPVDNRPALTIAIAEHLASVETPHLVFADTLSDAEQKRIALYCVDGGIHRHTLDDGRVIFCDRNVTSVYKIGNYYQPVLIAGCGLYSHPIPTTPLCDIFMRLDKSLPAARIQPV